MHFTTKFRCLFCSPWSRWACHKHAMESSPLTTHHSHSQHSFLVLLQNTHSLDAPHLCTHLKPSIYREVKPNEDKVERNLLCVIIIAVRVARRVAWQHLAVGLHNSPRPAAFWNDVHLPSIPVMSMHNSRVCLYVALVCVRTTLAMSLYNKVFFLWKPQKLSSCSMWRNINFTYIEVLGLE